MRSVRYPADALEALRRHRPGSCAHAGKARRLGGSAAWRRRAGDQDIIDARDHAVALPEVSAGTRPILPSQHLAA